MAFKSEKEKAKWVFKKQLKNNASHTKAYKKNWVDANLFHYSQTLDILEWREIRSGNFWELHDKLKSELERNNFTLQRVKQYLNAKK